MTVDDVRVFVDVLDLHTPVTKCLRGLSPADYTGLATELVDDLDGR